MLSGFSWHVRPMNGTRNRRMLGLLLSLAAWAVSVTSLLLGTGSQPCFMEWALASLGRGTSFTRKRPDRSCRTSLCANRALDNSMGGEPGEVACSQCRQWRPPSEFHKDATRANGLHTRCKQCMKSYQGDRRQRMRIANANKTPPSGSQLQCPHCRKRLPATRFAKHLGERNGVRWWCRTCQAIADKRLRQRYALANEVLNFSADFPKPEDWQLEEALGFYSIAEVNHALSHFGMKWCASCL